MQNGVGQLPFYGRQCDAPAPARPDEAPMHSADGDMRHTDPFDAVRTLDTGTHSNQ